MKISKSDRAIEEKFDLFCAANSFASILTSFNRLCALTVTAPTTGHPWNIYRELSAHVKPYWKGAELFKKLDKRVHSPDYMHQTVCSGVNALVIGCGPCGLRCAIELALLGARVVVVEKRDAFSRNNVLHLWPYLIEDLRGLGAKTFFGKFCVGSIDHVSIRTLQCILLKVALLFGVQIFPGVAYRGLVQPTSDVSDSFNLNVPNRLFVNQDTSSSAPLMNGHFRDVADHPSHVRRRHTPSTNGTVYHSELGHSRRTVGWRVRLEPEVVALQNYEIDVLIGADGKRSCIGFPSKELRCRLAIAITANFVNYRTQAETEVEEISGVASIFNQQFFARLASDTGIDLENIVYYKDETHYFVMTACKHSLLAKGVLKQDREDSERLLCSENIDHSALQAYARETANYVTRNQLPRLDFAINARGQPDVDVFDFTRIFAAEYSCRMLERKQHLLMQCLVGDGLFEPFWPTGSGCALGFLSALDAAWAVSRLATGLHPLQVLAQRESVYQRLSQTTPQNMPSNFADYTIDPKTSSDIHGRGERCISTKATNAKVACPPHHRCVLQNGYLDASKAKRVFREDPNWSVEKGLLLKRRAELIATLQDPASTKRHLSVQPLLSIKKRPFVRNGSDRSKSPRLKQLTSFPSYQPEQRNPPTRSRSNHEVNSSAHQTSTTSTNTDRLSGPRKGGGSTQCRMCNKRVYSIERVTAFGSNFHRNCLRCRVCDSQLQPEKAVRARTATSDTFFCLAHSPLKSNGGSKEPRSRASSTGVSAADRLRAGPLPPDNSRAPPVQESQNRPSVLARAHALENPPAAVLSRPSRRPVSNIDPSKSALLAGLSDGDDAVMGVVDVRALIRNFRGAPSDSSTSPSPVRRYVGSRKPLSAAPIGPSGDVPVDRLRAPGIRDEGAPGPDCFLAGHLGLPEVERRAIWELNTTIDLPDLSVSDLLEHMRSNRRAILGDGDYFASTESDDSHTACDSDALKTRVLPLPCKHKGRDSTTTVAPCNTHRTIESNITLTTMTTMNSSPALLSSQTSSVLDQTHPSSVMAAKRRFCMEPPKPLIIDPKQFISNKNRERTTTNSLSDCTEFTHPIQEVELLRRLTPPSNGSPLHSPGALVVRDLPLEATQVPLNSSTPHTSDCDVFDPFPNSHHLHSVIVSTPSPAASFAPLEQLRDIDSLSTTTTTTTTEHSSTERLSETDDLGPNISACPLPAQTPCLCPVVDIPAVDAFVSKSTGILIHPTSSEGSDVTDTSSADLDSAVVIRPIQTRAPSIIIQDERLPEPRSSPTEDTSSADCTQNDQLAPIVSAGQESSSSSLVYGSAHSMVGSDVRIPPMPLSLLQDSKIHLPKTSSEVGCACAPVFVKDFSQGAENLSRTHSLVSPDRPRPLAGAHSFSVPNLSDFLRSTNFVEPSESKVQC
ncbi:unnamed protein product [Dicrocoelium dendriticum]|nr:unnamed protein product [Dicrocoelium dendriticum]